MTETQTPASTPAPPARRAALLARARGRPRRRDGAQQGRRRARPAHLSRLPDRRSRRARDAIRRSRTCSGPATGTRRTACRPAPIPGRRSHDPQGAADVDQADGRAAHGRLRLGRDPGPAVATDGRPGPGTDLLLAVRPRGIRPAPRGQGSGRAGSVTGPRRGLPLPAQGRAARPGTARALDAYFIVGAEHGFNASTFTARVITSTRSDIASAVAGAIGTMKGPLHGGAPSEVVDQLAKVGSVEHAEEWLRGALDRGERLMGFGHRVYRAYDPRAAALRKVAEGMEHKPDWLAARDPGRGRRTPGPGRAAPGARAQDERRVLRGAGPPGRRPITRPLPGHVLAGPPRRLDRPRPRAVGRQPPDPPRRPLHRPRRARPARLTRLAGHAGQEPFTSAATRRGSSNQGM